MSRGVAWSKGLPRQIPALATTQVGVPTSLETVQLMELP